MHPAIAPATQHLAFAPAQMLTAALLSEACCTTSRSVLRRVYGADPAPTYRVYAVLDLAASRNHVEVATATLVE